MLVDNASNALNVLLNMWKFQPDEVFNTRFIILNAKFIILNTKFIIVNIKQTGHPGLLYRVLTS